MFQRVQQLLLGRRNRNRAKRAAKRAGSPVYIRRGEVERWVAPWDNATEPPPLLFPPSAPFVSLCHAFFLLFSTLRATVPLKTLNDRTAPREHQRQATIGRLGPSRVAWNCRGNRQRELLVRRIIIGEIIRVGNKTSNEKVQGTVVAIFANGPRSNVVK